MYVPEPMCSFKSTIKVHSSSVISLGTNLYQVSLKLKGLLLKKQSKVSTLGKMVVHRDKAITALDPGSVLSIIAFGFTTWNTIESWWEAGEGSCPSCYINDCIRKTGLLTLFCLKPPTIAYRLVFHSRMVLNADRRVEMPKGCITSSHKYFGQGRAVSVCDIRPDRVHRTICIW